VNWFNYAYQKDVKGYDIQKFSLLTICGVSFTFLLSYPYGNSSQDTLNRKLGGLQHWSELASTESNPAAKWALLGHGVSWGPPSHWHWSLCVLHVSNNYTLTVLLTIYVHTHSTQHTYTQIRTKLKGSDL
jgi:hypothetical protein